VNGRDRKVAAIGVILLLITGMGILLYPADETDADESTEVTDITYTVTWSTSSDTITDTQFVDRDGWQKDYSLHMGADVWIEKVTISIDWQESFNPQGILLSWNWSDRIEASVAIDELQFSRSISGYNRIEITASNGAIQETSIKAEEREDIESWIQDQTTDKLSCVIDLSITPKPWPFDRGNDVVIRITSYYRIPSIITL